MENGIGMNQSGGSSKLGELTHVGLDKVKRYDWAKLGPVGELAWVDKRKLGIDRSYQRDAGETKCLEIAGKFNWPACGVLLVGRRPDGSLWVYDGQHRLLAALRRSDVTVLPCIIHNMSGQPEEAQAFLDANVNRKPPTAVDKHKALVEARDPTASVVAQLIAQAGRSLGDSSPTSIHCVANIRKWIELDEARLRRLWPLLISVSAGAPFHARIIDTLCFIEGRIGKRSLTEPAWSQRLIARGAQRLMLDTAASAALYQCGGARAWSIGVIEAINKGLRSERRLRLDESDGGDA